MQNDPDATIVGRHRAAAAPGAAGRRNPAAPARRRNPAVLAGAAALLVLATCSGVTLLRSGHRTQAPPQVAMQVAPGPLAPLRSEAEILDARHDHIAAARFRPNPSILVIDFPDLTTQGLAFNRMAAFIEKRDLARDRLLTDQELAEAIRADGSTVETYYYGHDYRAADIQRFFARADEQQLALSRPEQDLRTLMMQEGLLIPGANAAVISIPREGSDPFVDAPGRTSLLRHELSHGEFFTNAAYADYVRYFWSTRMTEADRTGFRGFLARQGYDPANEDLMANETQAHLMHTTDRRYFNAAACGLPVARVEALRAEFVNGMPAGWLKDAAILVKPRLPS